jgi:serine/threonine protein kinase
MGTTHLPRGTRLQHGYQIVGTLGEGGQGRVYLARPFPAQPSDRPLVALKAASHSRVRNEFELLAPLSHRGIPEVYEIFEEAGQWFLVMQCLSGPGTLWQWQQGYRHAHLPTAFALAVIASVCEILAYLHDRGIVHCDLKPENILLTSSRSVALIDFGLACSLLAPKPTQELYEGGTPGYMAPEYREGIVSVQTDLYSLGATLHTLLKGFPPPAGYAPLLRLTPLDRLLSRLLARDPQRRPSSVQEVQAFLRTLALPGA